MYRRRSLVVTGTLILGAVAVFFLPPVHWRFIGWWNGEAFYLGRPTSYWSADIQDWEAKDMPNSWIAKVMVRLGLRESPRSRPRILEPDQKLAELLHVHRAYPQPTDNAPTYKAAVPVLVELLEDEHEQVRRQAALTLGHIGPDAQLGVPALIRLLRDQSQSVRNAARFALKEIAPQEEIEADRSGKE